MNSDTCGTGHRKFTSMHCIMIQYIAIAIYYARATICICFNAYYHCKGLCRYKTDLIVTAEDSNITYYSV